MAVAKENDFRFSNWMGTGDIGLGMVGEPHSIDARLYFQSSYLVPAASASGDIDLTLDEAWRLDGGLFLLLGSVPDDWRAFAARVRARRPESSNVLWVPNAGEPQSEWQFSFLRTRRKGAMLVLQEPAELPLSADPSGYRLHLAAGCTVELAAEGPGLAVRRGRKSGTVVSFGRDSERLPLDAGLDLEFTGPVGLRMDGQLTIPGGVAQAGWFDRLDVGLRYAYAIRTAGGAQRIETVRYPIVQPSGGAPDVAVRLSLAPGRLTDPDASFLEPVLSGNLVLPTWYRTLSGRPILLKPTSLRLVFDTLLDVPVPGRADGLALTPAGLFELSVGTFGSASSRKGVTAGKATPTLATPTTEYLACGAAGTEAVALPVAEAADPVAMLEFVPGAPGFAPGLASGQAEAGLTDRTRTSWIRLYRKGDPLPYLSQPPGDASMYRPDPPEAAAPVPLLTYLPMQAATLVAGDDPGLATFPMVPLAGVAPRDGAQGLELEVAAIAPTRKAQLGVRQVGPASSARKGRATDAETFVAVTPRGLECRFELPQPESEPVWKEAVLAKLVGALSRQSRRPRLRAGELDCTGTISLQDIGGPLESALLASQQCLVISDAASMATHLVDHTSVTLSGWTFHLTPDAEHWERYGTIVIVKNADAPLGQLALDVGSWTNAPDFNREPDEVRRRLATIFDDARRRYRQATERMALDAEPAEGGESDLEYFVNTVLDSPSWNGYLFLNVAVDVPDQLGGLRAGIEMDRFFAHHVGVTQRVFTSVEALETTSSALFGLVSYEGPTTPLAAGSDYRFRVRQLGLTFQNSMLTRFQAVLEVYLAKLFGKHPQPEAADRGVLVLDGTRQRRGEQDLYMFALREAHEFRFERGPLKAVRIAQAEFDTYSVEPVVPALPAGAARSVSSRFSFVGSLELAATKSLDEFDVLSFESLGFSALRLDMSFVEDGDPAAPTFAFQVGAMQLEVARSSARRGSLFADFPVKLGGILQGEGGVAPGAQGYMTVIQPVEVARLGRDWFGVVLVLDLGTLSDVAGSAGFEASLLTAWGAGDDEILLGLKLPGSSGPSASLSLLGVLQANIHALEMRGGAKAGFALMMNGVRLKAFGKTMPSSGSFDFYLFGNPDPSVDLSSLGWYGAYKREADDGTTASRPERRERRAAQGYLLPPRGTGDVPHNRFPPPVPRGGTKRHHDKES